MSEGCRNRRHLRLTPFSTPGDDEYEQSPPAAEGEKEPTESTKELVSPEGQGGLTEHLSTFAMETLLSFTLLHFWLFWRHKGMFTVVKKKKGMKQCCSV